MKNDRSGSWTVIGRSLFAPYLGLLAFVAAMVCSCETIKPYEKEYLLHPLMDDGVIRMLENNAMVVPAGQNERLSAGASAGGGSSCPTCGG